MAGVLQAHGMKLAGNETPIQLMARMRDVAKKRGIPGSAEHILADLAMAGMKDGGLRQQIKEAYRPAAPSRWPAEAMGTSAWLSSEDISTVMHQYEGATPGFKFVGVAPIDFADRPSNFGGRCVSPEMCSLDVAGLVAKGVTSQLGVVLNMDKHDSRGSHWVAAYVGLDPTAPNYGVFYYDSVANPPRERVAVWMRGIASAMAAGTRARGTRRAFTVEHNTVRRQFGHSECGVFSMMFLIHCIQRQLPFKDICKTLGGDAMMRAMRKVLFRPTPVPPAPQAGSQDVIRPKALRPTSLTANTSAAVTAAAKGGRAPARRARSSPVRTGRGPASPRRSSQGSPLPRCR